MTRSGESREPRADGSLEGPGWSSGQAGDVALGRGASGLGAALIGFSFKHHDPGLEMKKTKQKG